MPPAKAGFLAGSGPIAHPLFKPLKAEASDDQASLEDGVEQPMEGLDELEDALCHSDMDAEEAGQALDGLETMARGYADMDRLAARTYEVMAHFAESHSDPEIQARGTLYAALAVLASGDLEAGREGLTKIRDEFPEAEAIVSRMESDRRNALNEEVLEVWSRFLDEKEAEDLTALNSTLGRAENWVAGDGDSDPIERCRAQWNERRELVEAVASRLRSGENDTALAALEEIAEEGDKGLKARAAEMLEGIENPHRGKQYRGWAIPKLVGYAANLESGDRKAGADFAERLYEDADNLSILDGSVQTAHNLFSVLAAHSDDPELVADCKKRIRELETGDKSVARIIQEEVRTIGTDDLVTMAMMGGAAKIGVGVTLRSISLLEKAGVAAGKARWIAAALGFGAETNAIWGMNTLRQAATGDASQVFDKEKLARSYAANLVSMGFLKGSGAIGGAIGKRLAASGPRLSVAVSHGTALGGMIAGNQVAGAMRLSPEPRGGTKEAIVKDVFQYFKYAAGPKVFDKMRSVVASGPARRTLIEIKTPRSQGVRNAQPEPTPTADPIVNPDPTLNPTSGRLPERTLPGLGGPEPVRNFGTLPGLGGPLPQEGQGGVERTGRGYDEATTPGRKASKPRDFVGNTPKPAVELDLGQVTRQANDIIEYYDHPKTQATLKHFLGAQGTWGEAAENAIAEVAALREAVEQYTRLADVQRTDPTPAAADELPIAGQNMVRIALRLLHSPFDRMLAAHAARVGRLEGELSPLKRSLAISEVSSRTEGRPNVQFDFETVRPEEGPESTRDLIKVEVSVTDAAAGQKVLDRLNEDGFVPSSIRFEGSKQVVTAEVPCRRIEDGRVVTGFNRVAVTIEVDGDLASKNPSAPRLSPLDAAAQGYKLAWGNGAFWSDPKGSRQFPILRGQDVSILAVRPDLPQPTGLFADVRTALVYKITDGVTRGRLNGMLRTLQGIHDRCPAGDSRRAIIETAARTVNEELQASGSSEAGLPYLWTTMSQAIVDVDAREVGLPENAKVLPRVVRIRGDVSIANHSPDVAPTRSKDAPKLDSNPIHETPVDSIQRNLRSQLDRAMRGAAGIDVVDVEVKREDQHVVDSYGDPSGTERFTTVKITLQAQGKKIGTAEWEFSQGYYGEKVGFLREINIDPSVRGQGVAEKLNGALGKFTSSMGIQSTFLYAQNLDPNVDPRKTPDRSGLVYWPKNGFKWVASPEKLPPSDQRGWASLTWEGSPVNVQSIFFKWATETQGWSAEKAHGFLRDNGNNPREYPQEFLIHLGKIANQGSVPYVREIGRQQQTDVPALAVRAR